MTINRPIPPLPPVGARVLVDHGNSEETIRCCVGTVTRHIGQPPWLAEVEIDAMRTGIYAPEGMRDAK